MVRRQLSANGPQVNLQPPRGHDPEIPVAKSAKDVQVTVPSNVELFLDNADVPHIKILDAKGRQVYPLTHNLVRGWVTAYLHRLKNERLPTKAEVDACISLLGAHAMINGRRESQEDWRDDLLERDSLTLCIYTLANRKAPNPWDATPSQILDAVDLLAAKEHIEKGEDWPRSAQRLSIALEQRQLVLNDLGVLLIKLARQSTARKWRIQMKEHDANNQRVIDASQVTSSCEPQAKPSSDNELQLASSQKDALAKNLEEIVTGGLGTPLTEDQILAWLPKTWDQIVGNEILKDELQLLVGDLLDRQTGPNFLLTGAESTGKDSSVLHTISVLLCYDPDMTHSEPCGVCENCLCEVDRGTSFGDIRKGDDFQFMHIDCETLTADKLAFEASKVRAYPGRLLVYLSHLDRLAPNRVHDLLQVMEDRKYLWLATAPQAGDVPQEVLHHFKVQQPNLPSEDKLATFLAERCRDWSITVDSGHSLIRLAHICGQVTGTALRVLARAASGQERRLTLDLVENSFGETD